MLYNNNINDTIVPMFVITFFIMAIFFSFKNYSYYNIYNNVYLMDLHL